MSVVKKRTGGHEASIREYRIGSDGIQVGQPLRDFSGVMTGVPQFVGSQNDLLTAAG